MMPLDFLEQILIDYYFYILILHFILIVTFLFLNFKKLKKLFVKVKQSSWILLILVMIFGLYLRLTLSTMYDHTGGDWGYKLIGKHFLLEQKHRFCSIGSFEDCRGYNFHDHPAGFSYILFISFLLFGISNEVTLFTSLFFGWLTILAVFLLSYILFKDEKISLFSALIMAIIPWHIFLSGTGSVHIVSAFFATFTMFLFFFSLNKNEPELWGLFLLFLIFSAEIKIENLILLIISVASSFIFKNQKQLKEIIKKMVSPSIVSILLSLPLFYYLIYLIIFNPWGSGKELFSLEYLFSDIDGIYRYLGSSNLFPPLFLGFIVISMFSLKRYKKQIVFLLIYIISFALLYGSYYLSLFPSYILSIIPAYSILIGIGISCLHKQMKNIKSKEFFLGASFTLIFLILFSVFTPQQIINPKREDIWKDEIVENLISSVKEAKDCDWVFVLTEEERRVVYFSSPSKVLSIEGKTQNDINNILKESNKTYFIVTPHGNINFYKFLEQNFELNLLYAKDTVKVYEISN